MQNGSQTSNFDRDNNLWHARRHNGEVTSDYLGVLLREEAIFILEFYRETEGKHWVSNRGWEHKKCIESPHLAFGLKAEVKTTTTKVAGRIKGTTVPVITHMCLPRNNLRITLGVTPAFASSIAALTSLQMLDLSNNLLRGILTIIKYNCKRK
jgi:hypothetical protein